MENQDLLTKPEQIYLLSNSSVIDPIGDHRGDAAFKRRPARRGAARQGKARQGKARQGKARQGKAQGPGVPIRDTVRDRGCRLAAKLSSFCRNRPRRCGHGFLRCVRR
jgi:hypothetical protein